MRSTGIPIQAAARRLTAIAFIAFPVSVWVKKP